MSTELTLFIILGTVAVASALGMLFSRNAVYAALFLILNFATVAVFYLILSAPFIALAQVTGAGLKRIAGTYERRRPPPLGAAGG